MNLRPYILVSLVANLLLTCALLYRAAELNRPGQAGLRPLSISRTATEIELETANPQPTPAVRAVAPPFNWRQIESGDYKIYIANLKGISCPPATIRDIIFADVNDQYAHKRSQALAGRQPEFWNVMAKGGKAFDAAFTAPAVKLGDEKGALLKELLALIGPTGDFERPATDLELRALVNFLDPVKQEKLIALESRYRDLRAQMQNYLANDPEGLRTKNKVLTEEKQKELEQLLSPSEMEEYQLRRSPEAAWARDIRGFTPTDGEFHAIAKLMRDYDSTHPAADKRDRDARPKETERQSAIDQQVRGLLGNQRFAELKRSMDGEYQLLTQITGRCQMPLDAANAAYSIKQASEQQAARLNQQTSLTDDDRQAAISAIQAEAARSLQKTLGDGGWQTYQRYGGGWLANLGR